MSKELVAAMNCETGDSPTWAQKHRTVVLLADELLGRLIYWVPTNQESNFREIAWGLLQLHRLLFDVLTTNHPQSYGTSVSVEPSIPANEIRCLLSILQHLWPIVHALARNKSNARVWIERLRFVLRLTLLGSYWTRRSPCTGILLQGGIFHNWNGYSTDEEQRLVEREIYVGKRCGRQLLIQGRLPSLSTKWSQPMRWKRSIHQLCELAYIVRPLLSAEAGNRGLGYKWDVFCATLLLDLTSIGLLQKVTTKSNIVSQNEVKRRKLRILLYLLREPCWGSFLQPLMERLGSTVNAVPLVGSLIRSYLWEYLLYAKLYLLEE
ncbi:hypothetical protein FisN_6Hh100 [Fistulifera solaris]|uniref:Peroxisomal membrane protein PEX16 n=1 Tax=Fistulifera solaris TaxID=1519565 RepID=A0A1Z5KIE6_FISSO|nr:hypothetical protein FisN_6Hh100 [Fistulifera solaris]|eukprot:GAX25862.1 hypothetical protein FisN_6Hh100 [Fistulifera solaris]